MRGTARRVTAAALVGSLLPLAACSDDKNEPMALRVLAAASLVDAFDDLAEDFEAEHDDVDVQVIPGSSTALAEQAADGAPGDVLATADEAAMELAVTDKAVTDYHGFATNVLVIAVPPDNPGGVRGIDDLAGATWVRCADEAPCGKVALAVLEAHDVSAEPASLEEDARATLDKVMAGEAEAALVYRTDALAAGDAVKTIEIPGAEELRTTYFIGALEQASDSEVAQDFVDLVLSDPGREILADAGFGSP